MEREIHIFDNGIKVYDDHLIPVQRERYKVRNVHEADEEDIFVKIIHAIPSNGCYVNIGSAIGYYPLLAKRLAPELIIYAVEPLDRHRAFFIENIALNGLKSSDFNIHKECVSSSDGKVEFVDDAYGSSIHRNSEKKAQTLKSAIKKLLFFTGLKKSKNVMSVETMTLDNMLEGIGRPVDLCQMDVQGFEMDVLKGARHALQTGGIKTFLIGTHSRTLHKDCMEVLMDNGYAIELEEYDTKEQPDGILVASKDTHRPIIFNNET